MDFGFHNIEMGGKTYLSDDEKKVKQAEMPITALLIVIAVMLFGLIIVAKQLA